MTTSIILRIHGRELPAHIDRLRDVAADAATRTITATDEHGAAITVLLGANDNAIITHATPHQET